MKENTFSASAYGPQVEPHKSRKQRLMEAATREYTTRCIACDTIVAHGRVKGRTEAALNASNQAKIDEHKRTCPSPSEVERRFMSEAGLEEPQK